MLLTYCFLHQSCNIFFVVQYFLRNESQYRCHVAHPFHPALYLSILQAYQNDLTHLYLLSPPKYYPFSIRCFSLLSSCPFSPYPCCVHLRYLLCALIQKYSRSVKSNAILTSLLTHPLMLLLPSFLCAVAPVDSLPPYVRVIRHCATLCHLHIHIHRHTNICFMYTIFYRFMTAELLINVFACQLLPG
jgi:hypothetical protein